MQAVVADSRLPCTSAPDVTKMALTVIKQQILMYKTAVYTHVNGDMQSLTH